MTSRDLVKNTLEFTNKKGKVPRNLWTLPWADMNYPEQLKKIRQVFPEDIQQGVETTYSSLPEMVGNCVEIGTSVDDWGCVRENLYEGIIGQVKSPLIESDDWDNFEKVHIPYEWLSFDISEANTSVKNTDKFTIAGACPNPFERLQYIRTTENLYIDLIMRPKNMFVFLEKMHTYYCELLEKWAKTDVDALVMMDDWGSQRSLLINPEIWRELFKPMYKDYIDIAHRAGKKMFMNSDGYILDIMPDLVELGLDAINSQLFCMGFEQLKKYAGKITFWGEIDRQNLLPYATEKEIEEAVQTVRNNLWVNGGCIAQCEFGPGANPNNVYAVFKAWDKY